MLSHVHIGTNDFPRALAFYGGILEELGYVLKFREDETSWAGWMEPGKPRPLLLVGRPFDGQPAVPGNGQMTALLAPSRAAVDRSYARALALGASDEGGPRPAAPVPPGLLRRLCARPGRQQALLLLPRTGVGARHGGL